QVEIVDPDHRSGSDSKIGDLKDHAEISRSPKYARRTRASLTTTSGSPSAMIRPSLMTEIRLHKDTRKLMLCSITTIPVPSSRLILSKSSRSPAASSTDTPET